MSTWCIGDLHACDDEFGELLQKIGFNPAVDRLLLTGDLIGRGPKPLETLERLLALPCARAVLGNHDLNFLAVCEGIVPAREKDHLDPLLSSPRLPAIIEYLAGSRLLIVDHNLRIALSHAGILPQWDLTAAMEIAGEIEAALSCPTRRRLLLRNMYANEPDKAEPGLAGIRLWRLGLNAFTRMRLCTPSGRLDFAHKEEGPEEARHLGLVPWYELPGASTPQKQGYTQVFGHWAALAGKCHQKGFKALDTGCLWGGSLTAWCAETQESVRVKSHGHLRAGN